MIPLAGSTDSGGIVFDCMQQVIKRLALAVGVMVGCSGQAMEGLECREVIMSKISTVILNICNKLLH